MQVNTNAEAQDTAPQEASSTASENIPIGVNYKPAKHPGRATDCACTRLFDPIDPRMCLLCKKEIKQVSKVYQEKIHLAKELSQAQHKLQSSRGKTDELFGQVKELKIQLEDSGAVLDAKNFELDRTKHDLEILGEKLTDAIEQRAELQHAKEALSSELEDLTQSLFEEANTMVATEAKMRYHHEQRVIALYVGRQDSKRPVRNQDALANGTAAASRTPNQIL